MSRARLTIALAALALLAAVSAPSAQAKPKFESCAGVPCFELDVPLDRSGAAPGEVSLKVQMRRALRGPRRGLTFLLAGGPGQSAISAFGPGFISFEPPYQEWRRLTPHNAVVAFDQRGTGDSGLLRCRDLEWASTADPGRAAEACAVLLGKRRAFYRTADSVADMEAVRVALGAPKVTIIGVSYGTLVAQQYAIAHPDRVQRLVLDSVVDTAGVDPFYRDSFVATERSLAALCAAKRCRGFSRDAVADVQRLVARLAEGPLRGYVVGRDGRRKDASLTRQGLFLTFGAGDFDPLLRADFPAAVVSALRGDLAPLLRLKRRALQVEGGGSPREISTAVLAATLCEETAFPYARGAALTSRPSLALEAAGLIDPALLAPFDVTTAASNDLLRFCRKWPTAAADSGLLPGPLPDVPTLLLAGGTDTRTPIETARRVADGLPRGQLLVAPGVGHSVLGGSECANRAAKRFIRGKETPKRCKAARGLPQTRPAPVWLGDLEPAFGVPGDPGRVLRAVSLTFADMSKELLSEVFADLLFGSNVVRGAGLRGGTFALRVRRRSAELRIDRLELVRGVRLSGSLVASGRRGPRGVVRITGSAGPDGFVRFRGPRLSGRIGGRPFRVDADVDVSGARERERSLILARRGAASPFPLTGR